MSGEATEYPPWWPPGLDEEYLCESNCDHCARLQELLDQHRSGVAIDGDHAPLDSFAQS
jgi:hypothetical protein